MERFCRVVSKQVVVSEAGDTTVDRLAVTRDLGSQLLFAGCSDGSVKLFDLRAPHEGPAACLKPHASPIVSRPPSSLAACPPSLPGPTVESVFV
jgi:hypothetical protein